ncbi:MAG: hypothetical protein ACE5ER_12175, partial [Nitrospinaceae bacterium]
MRTFWLMIAVLWLVSGMAQAQVAAPMLNPLSTGALSTTNPGVLPWDGPSRVGGGLADLDSESTNAGVVSPNFTGDGKFLLARFVGEMFAFGAEVLQFDIEDNAGNSASVDFVSMGFGAQFGDTFGVGVAREIEEFEDPTLINTQSLTVFGASLRLGEVFYLGAATGTENVENATPILTVDADRTVSRFGVAYQTRDGEDGLHLEAYKEMVDLITNPFNQDEEDKTGIVLEIVFSNILLGVESINTDFTDNAGVVQ